MSKLEDFINIYTVRPTPEVCNSMRRSLQELIEQEKSKTIAKLRKEIEGKKKYDFCPDELGNGMGYLNESNDGAYVKVSDINEYFR